MMGTKNSLAAFCIALLMAATATGADLQFVDPLGRPDKLAIEGATTFSSHEIRVALFNELDVLAACAPETPLAELTAIIAKKTTSGYREAGFFDVNVSVTAADDKLMMTINEGDRYFNGAIDVSGNRQLDAAQIKAELTKPKTTGLKPRPAWRSAEAASFTAETEARLTSKVLASVNDQGYYRPKLKVTVEPERRTKQAALRINISDEGPVARLSDVEMTGNERNRRAAVIAHLGLDASTSLTRETREQIERRLLASGRFVRARWELGEPEERGASWRPRLALLEYELAPPIEEPLAREEAALLKVAEWFQALDESHEELLCQSGEGALVFAPQRGFVALLKGWDDNVAGKDGPAFDYAIVVDEDRVGLYSRPQQRKIFAQPPPSPVTGEAIVTLVDGAPEWSGQRTDTLKFGLSSATHKGYCRHVEVQFELTAAAALSVVRKHKAKVHWDGDVVSFEWDKCQLRANALTGQLIEHVVKPDSPVDGDQAEVSSRLVVKPGEFDRRLGEIEKASAEWPNAADPRRPLSCVAEFLCYEIERFNAYCGRHAGDDRDDFGGEDDDPEVAEFRRKFRQEVAVSFSEGCAIEQRGYAALRKAISLGVLEPFDRLLCQAFEAPQDGFSIPLPLFHVRAGSLEEFRSLGRELAPLFGVRVGNRLFPVNGWMNAAWRLGLFAVAKKQIELPRKSHGPLSDEPGPLGTLAAAELLREAGADFESKAYALRDLPSRSVVAFRNERRELVSGEGLVSEFLLKAAATMRQLDAADIEALVQLLVELELLDGPSAGAIELAALRAHAEDSPTQAAIQALNALWRAGLSDWVERRLDALGSAPDESRRQHRTIRESDD